MRILILSQFFQPESNFKGLPFAAELMRRGHDVQVLTGFPNYPGGKVYAGYRIRPWQRELLDDVEVIRVALYPSHDRSGLRRALNYASFALSAGLLGTCLIRKPDVAYVYHPPATIGLPALVLKKLRGVPIVYDIQDMWPDTIEATGMLRSPTILRVLAAWCRLVYRMVDRVVVLSPGFKRLLVERGVPAEKIEVIYNWCDERALFSEPNASHIVAKVPEFEGRFNLVFAGTMGAAQGLDAVLDAARLVGERIPIVQFVFVGGGVDRNHLQERATNEGLRNTLFIPRQPLEAMAPILAAADVVMVHLKDAPMFSITIPSKTQAFLAAGKPILMAVRGDAAELVERAGAGLACSPDNADSIAGAVERFVMMSGEDRAQMGRRGQAFYTEHLSMRAGIDAFERLLEEAAVSCELSQLRRAGTGGIVRDVELSDKP